MHDEKINLGFWKKAKEKAAGENRPILILAPMADVTDAAFRQIIAKYSRMGKKGGGPDVMWTEFVSADGLCSAGREVLLNDLIFSKNERPIVAQLFTSHPEKMREASVIVADLGFDGLDINMGCPDRSVEKQCAGAAMMKDPKNAIEVIKAAREGVESVAPGTGTFLGLRDSRREIVSSLGLVTAAKRPRLERFQLAQTRPQPSESSVPVATTIPISVKTRIGYNKIEIDTWIRMLLEQKLPVLTIHLRTRKEMSDVPAHWELMPEIVRLRDQISPETLIIGNGDADSLEDANKKAKESGCDGIMFGRAIFGNPWFFDTNKVKRQNAKGKDESQKPKAEITECLNAMLEHTELFEKYFDGIKSFATMKKHYKAYVNGWDGAKELRMELMEAENAAKVRKIVEIYK